MSDLPEVKYGDKPPADWRELEQPEDPDDELIQTPDDVVDILGFDPAEVDEAEDEELEAKKPKSEVNFEHPAKGPNHCSQCIHFDPERACELVEGQIEPEDWCRLFELDDRAEDEIEQLCANDRIFTEEDHPRDSDGKFTDGSGGSLSSPPKDGGRWFSEGGGHHVDVSGGGPEFQRNVDQVLSMMPESFLKASGLSTIYGHSKNSHERWRGLTGGGFTVKEQPMTANIGDFTKPKDMARVVAHEIGHLYKFNHHANSKNPLFSGRAFRRDAEKASPKDKQRYQYFFKNDDEAVAESIRHIFFPDSETPRFQKAFTETMQYVKEHLHKTGAMAGDVAQDAEWKESKHPRDKGGKFSTVAGGGAGAETDASRAGVPSKDKQKEAVAGVTDYLSTIRQSFPQQAGPDSNYGIQLDSGKQFFADENTYEGRRGRPHACYANASRAAMSDHDLTYVEGYVTVHGVPIEHAWTVDKQGRVRDPTIKDPAGIGGYYGVPIKTDYLVETMMRTKVFGVFGFHNREIYDSPPSTYLASVPGGDAVEKDASPKRVESSESPAYSLMEGHSTPSVAEFMKTLKPSQRRYLADATAKLAAASPTDGLVVNGGHRQEDGTWTPTRQDLHAQIIRKILTPEKIKAARPEAGKDPVFTMIGGRAGSGKSFVTREGGPVDASKNLVIDNDEIKKQLPEYEGWNAAMVHEEASFIVERVINMARQLKLNVVLDGTMKSLAPAQERLEQFKDAGYKLHGYYVFAPPAVAARRAVDRAIRTERYVSPAYVLGSTSNERSFDGMRSYFHRWQVYDSTEPGTMIPKLRFYGGPEHE